MTDMGQPITLSQKATRGVFSMQEKISDGRGGAIYQDSPRVVIPTSEIEIGFEGGANGSTVIVDDVFYTVISMVDQGDGMTELRLAMV